MNPYYIYGLVCPIEGKIFYVGCTKNISSRLSGHKSNKQDTNVGRYVAELTKRGLNKKITAEILEIVTPESDGYPSDIETFWIHEIGKTNELTNGVKGHWYIYKLVGKAQAIRDLRKFRKENVGMNSYRRKVVKDLKLRGLLNIEFIEVLDKKAVAEMNELLATI